MPRRFDIALMDPPTAASTSDAALTARIRRWCEAGALPRLTERLAVACTRPHDGIDAAARDLDGNDRLACMGTLRGLAWRLRVAMDDRRADRSPRSDDPWDCGWWRPGAFDAARRFRPRRATLLMAREPDAAAIGALWAALSAAIEGFDKPVRLLLVMASPCEGLPSI